MNSLKKIAEMSQKLEQLKDSRSEFIENLLAAFERDHPDFIEHLKECGLDDRRYSTGSLSNKLRQQQDALQHTGDETDQKTP